MVRIRGWKKVQDRKYVKIWVNDSIDLRLIVRKGSKSWQAWYEKNVGKPASDESYIPNAFITALVDRDTAISKATQFMKSKTGLVDNKFNYRAGDKVVYIGPGVGTPFYPRKDDKYKVLEFNESADGRIVVSLMPYGHDNIQPTNNPSEFKKVNVR